MNFFRVFQSTVFGAFLPQIFNATQRLHPHFPHFPCPSRELPPSGTGRDFERMKNSALNKYHIEVLLARWQRAGSRLGAFVRQMYRVLRWQTASGIVSMRKSATYAPQLAHFCRSRCGGQSRWGSGNPPYEKRAFPTLFRPLRSVVCPRAI